MNISIAKNVLSSTLIDSYINHNRKDDMISVKNMLKVNIINNELIYNPYISGQFMFLCKKPNKGAVW